MTGKVCQSIVGGLYLPEGLKFPGEVFCLR